MEKRKRDKNLAHNTAVAVKTSAIFCKQCNKCSSALALIVHASSARVMMRQPPII
jgi:hypothetical protein